MIDGTTERTEDTERRDRVNKIFDKIYKNNLVNPGAPSKLG